jgi:superfamily II DNA or RNA helicase
MAADVTISNINEAFVKLSCEEGISYELRDAFTFMVPGAQFTPQFKARLWDGKIRLWDTRKRMIYRGLVPYIAKFCEDRGYTWEYDNEVYDEELSLKEIQEFAKTLGLPHVPRDYQYEGCLHAIRSRRCLLLSPTASGKSLIIYLILRYLHDKLDCKRTLVIVPTISLVTQLASDFRDYGFDADNLVHRIFAGEDKHTDKPITISTWQSLYKMPPEYFRQFDVVIGDEAHQFKAKSLTDIMTGLTNAKFRIGTTGTLDGTKTHKLVLEGLFGLAERVATTKELMDKNRLAEFEIKCLVLKHDDEICELMKKTTYQEEIEYLILNETRNKFIKNLAVSLKGNTLILYQYVDKHGKILYDLITNTKNIGDRKVFFIYGKTDVETRENVRSITEKEENAIIIASYGTFSTGINIRNLHNVIFASPSKSRVRNLQSIGRALRIGDKKEKAILYDIADDLRYKNYMNHTLKHFVERTKLYNEEKFVYKLYKIGLKNGKSSSNQVV